MELQQHLDAFNAEYLRITGKKAKPDTWVWANIFGVVLSEYSESFFAAGWDAGVIHDKVRWSLDHEMTFAPAPVAISRFKGFALLYETVGCMVKPSEQDGLYMPDTLK